MTKKSLSDHAHARVLAAATEYLSAHYDQEVSISDVAAAAGVGARTLQIAFRDGLKTTPGTWLMKLRLRRARQALLAPDPDTSVTSAAHGAGLHHLGRFSKLYREEFGESPSETLKSALKLRDAEKRQSSLSMFIRAKNEQFGTLPTPEKKATTSIECCQLIASSQDIFDAWDRIHTILSEQHQYKRGAVILKRNLDGRPLIFSHCRGGMDDDHFRTDMNRVNTVLSSAKGIVESVLREGNPRLENNLEMAVDYAALDASIQSKLCVPLVSAGEIVGAINFESEQKNAFDLHDLALASAIASSTVGQLQTARSQGDLGVSDRV